MVLSPSITTLEQQKFKETSLGNTSIRTCQEGGTTDNIDVSISTNFDRLTLTVTDSAIAIPTTPLSGRNSLQIQNFSNTETIYIGGIGVTAGRINGSTTNGWEIGPLESWNQAVTDNFVMYAICDSGKSAQIKIVETK